MCKFFVVVYVTVNKHSACGFMNLKFDFLLSWKAVLIIDMEYIYMLQVGNITRNP